MSILRSALDRFLILVARVALRLLFREVVVEGRERVPRDKPLIVVANHFNGFIDPVMLMTVFGRLPRFLAKATLWDRPAFRPFLAVAGMIPVYRRQDGAGVSANSSMFAACHDVLSRGALIGVFPEGTTHDDLAIHGMRTGAARIALGARASGVAGIAIVPAGLTFDDKIALRTGVLARVGRPIDVDEVAQQLATGPGAGEADRDAVRALTAMIAERLREVAPNYHDVREAGILRRAAQITIQSRNSPGAPADLGDRERLARRLAQAPQGQRRDIAEALARYHLDLELMGLRDQQVASQDRVTRLLRRTLAVTGGLVVLAPLAFVGALWNLVPYWLVRLAGSIAASPVSKGTARLLAALIAFPLAWIAVVMLDAFHGVIPGVVVVALAPVLGLVSVGWSESLVHVYRDWRAFVALTERRVLLPSLFASRAAVVNTVDRALRARRDGSLTGAP